MPTPLELAVKDRFMQAITNIAKENFPALKESDIAVSIGMQISNYYRITKGDQYGVTVHQLGKLCELYGISGEWLLNGKGYMKATNEKLLAPLELLKEVVRQMENTKKKVSAPRQKTK